MDTAERGPRERWHRLAEMVWHLTDCDPQLALAAVGRPITRAPEHDDALMVVARALCRVRRIDLTHTVDLTEKLDLRDKVENQPPVSS